MCNAVPSSYDFSRVPTNAFFQYLAFLNANMKRLSHSATFLIPWMIRGSQSRVLSEPTQRTYIMDNDLPPIQTQMIDLPEPRHFNKRETTSPDVYTITIAPGKTCGWLSGSVGAAITCTNQQPCMWFSAGIICGNVKKLDSWEIHLRCYDRDAALNTQICDDVCQRRNVLRW